MYALNLRSSISNFMRGRGPVTRDMVPIYESEKVESKKENEGSTTNQQPVVNNTSIDVQPNTQQPACELTKVVTFVSDTGEPIDHLMQGSTYMGQPGNTPVQRLANINVPVGINPLEQTQAKPEVVVDPNNEYLVKHPELSELYAKVCALGKCIISDYNGLIQFDVATSNKPNVVFYVDVNGLLYDNNNKIIIMTSDKIEDGYYTHLANYDLALKYVEGVVSVEILKNSTMITHIQHEINKYIDLASIPKGNDPIDIDKLIANIITLKPYVDRALKEDSNARFRFVAFRGEDNFIITSDSTVKTEFFGKTIKRISQSIEFKPNGDVRYLCKGRRIDSEVKEEITKQATVNQSAPS